MKPIIKLAFSDFWSGFDPDNNYFTQLLRTRFNVVISDTPDFLIYSWFGKSHLKYKCYRIFFSGENERPDFRICDFAFTFDHLDHPDHYRLPLYALYCEPETLIKRDFNADQVLADKKKFCNFVYSNHRCRKRNQLFRQLSKYKQVDSGGRYLNNIWGPVRDKMAFIRQYKFTIAFENEASPGYTTEKIVQPMLAGSLPIYWGNPLVHLDFNPKSFISYYDYGSNEALIERVMEIDQNDDLYLEYLRQPNYNDNQIPDVIKAENVLRQFEYIFSTTRVPVAVRRSRLYFVDQMRRYIVRDIPWMARRMAGNILK